MKKNYSIILVFALISIFSFQSCKKDEKSNDPPVISSVMVTPNNVSANGMATVSVTATDPDNDNLSYSYNVSGGSINGNGATASWTAPSQEGAYSVTVSVSDGNGGEASGNASLSVQAAVTQITGTASFPAGTAGDLANAKVSLYTSYDNWVANQPILHGGTQGSGANVTFTIPNVMPGAYYMDIWKDNDFSASWTAGDFVGWYGSGGLGSPSLTQFQIIQGQTMNINVQMLIIL